MLLRDRSEVIAAKYRVTCQKPVGDRAERIDIGIGADLAASQLFWGERLQAAVEEPGLTSGGQQFIETPDAKVRNGYLPIHLQVDAIEGEVAVEGCLLVRIFQDSGDLVDIATRRHDIQHTALRQPRGQRAHRRVGPDEIRKPLMDAITDHRQHIRMPQGDDMPRLALQIPLVGIHHVRTLRGRYRERTDEE